MPDNCPCPECGVFKSPKAARCHECAAMHAERHSQRNQLIYQLRRDGLTLREIAGLARVTPDRVRDIVLRREHQNRRHLHRAASAIARWQAELQHRRDLERAATSLAKWQRLVSDASMGRRG